jgi:hypothetical protein
VSYEAPAGCPSGVEFLAALRSHLQAGGDGAIDASVRITGPSGGVFELELALRVAGETTASRMRADSCETLMQVAALNASMARTPADGIAAAPLAPSLLSAPIEPSMGVNHGNRGAAVLDSAGDAASRNGPPAPRLGGFALAEVRTASGMLPALAWGRGLVVGVALEPWSLRLSGTWWLPVQHTFSGDGSSPVNMEFEQQSLELAPCVGRALSALLRLDACASLSGHRTQTSTAEPRVWGAFGVAAFAVLRPWRGLRAEVAAQLLVPMSAPSFAVDTLEDVYRSGVLQPGARLAMGWEFGGAEQPPAYPPSFEVTARALPRGQP